MDCKIGKSHIHGQMVFSILLINLQVTTTQDSSSSFGSSLVSTTVDASFHPTRVSIPLILLLVISSYVSVWISHLPLLFARCQDSLCSISTTLFLKDFIGVHIFWLVPTFWGLYWCYQISSCHFVLFLLFLNVFHPGLTALKSLVSHFWDNTLKSALLENRQCV